MRRDKKGQGLPIIRPCPFCVYLIFLINVGVRVFRFRARHDRVCAQKGLIHCADDHGPHRLYACARARAHVYAGVDVHVYDRAHAVCRLHEHGHVGVDGCAVFHARENVGVPLPLFFLLQLKYMFCRKNAPEARSFLK